MRELLLMCAWFVGVVYSTIPSFWLLVHPFAERWRERRGRVLTQLGLIWLGEIMLVLAITFRYRQEVLYSNPLSWLLWAALFLIGMTVYRRIGGHFGLRRLIGESEVRPEAGGQHLIVSGMHARVRHPIYLAHLCMLSAWTLGSGLKVLFALWIFAVTTGAVMIRLEERELEQRFGEHYREYKRRVPAVFPKIRA
jgi:methanethiol S-methyltransferase